MVHSITANFYPLENHTLTWATSNTSQNVQFTLTFDTGGKIPSSIEVSNALTVGVFVNMGVDNTVTATSANYYIGPGVDKIFDAGPSRPAWIAVMPISSTSGSVYISRGAGN